MNQTLTSCIVGALIDAVLFSHLAVAWWHGTIGRKHRRSTLHN